MAKLTVKNVGPIREAEFEVKKHTVFIGPQGSGKSTLAKLIAIGGDEDLKPNSFTGLTQLINKYNIGNYFSNHSKANYSNGSYSVQINNVVSFDLSEKSRNELDRRSAMNFQRHLIPNFEEYRNGNWIKDAHANFLALGGEQYVKRFFDDFFARTLEFSSAYIPAERTLTAVLSSIIWSLIYADTSLPKAITLFGRSFEIARNNQSQIDVPFLEIRYSRENGKDNVYFKFDEAVSLAQSASGYQSLIPLLLVVEQQRKESQRRFIIEEPELNLYPTAQKDLIYALMSGLDPNIEYKDAEWVITTHSPYVLSSFNTLMLAYKVAQRSDELRAEVEKIIPARCWINPDEFAAYYVDKGTVRSIISEKTGLIADNELDDVSEDLAGEQDQLLELYRNIPSA